MTTSRIVREIVTHYESCLDQHGDTPQGVDWPNAEDAAKRYRVMLDVIRAPGKVRLLDFGCGASHLYEYLCKIGNEKIQYSGLDLSRKFIELSRAKYPEVSYHHLDLLAEPDALPLFDYIVMNGVFTERLSVPQDEMTSYFQDLIRAVFRKAQSGVAFNVMSKQVDWEREDLFHFSLDALAEFLIAEFGRNFVIRNDYGLYEYTVYLYRG